MDVLVLAAFAPELDPLWPALGQRADGRIAHLAISGRVCGVGLVAATAGAATHIAAARPRAVVAVGTCGAYARSGVGVGAVLVARRLVLSELGTLLGAAQVPDAVGTEAATDASLSRALASAGARLADVTTTLGVTVDDEVASRIESTTGVQAEHMEAYGFAAACAAFGVPFAAVLGVANVVGSQGRVQWRSNHAAASVEAVAHVTRWLTSGAPGLADR